MARQSSSFEWILPPRPEGVSAFRWLRNALRDEILAGRIQPGSRLPSSRELARQYHLSRATILAALEELQAEGYLEGRRGSGTYVSQQLLQLPARGAAPAQSSAGGPALQGSSAPPSRPRVSSFAARVQPMVLAVKPQNRAFRTNLPALDLFPTTLWAQVAARRMRSATAAELLGCDAAGYLPLRQAIAAYSHQSRGIRCAAEQIVIVSGVQEGLDLSARLLVDSGDTVLLEDPGYQGAHTLFQAMGARIVSMPVDAEGAAPFEADFRGCRLVYVTPGHQYPLGVTMSLPRRLQLLAWANQYNVPIFEDDYDSEFRFSGRPIPAVQGLDEGGKVIFCGSFNKTIFPSLRLGYLVLPQSLLEPFLRAKAITTRHHSNLLQAPLCDFMEMGHLGRHLRRMRKIYAERFALLCQSAEQYLAEYLEVARIEAGLQTIAHLRRSLTELGITAEQVAQAAAQHGIDVVPLSFYCHNVQAPEALQIGFAAVEEREIRIGAQRLADVLEHQCAQARSQRRIQLPAQARTQPHAAQPRSPGQKKPQKHLGG
ncbi:MAG: PLP-dependent aminotransferase family protein [Acidobacteriaceae bacterium]